MDWSAFFSAFGLVFIAELGDKTQLAVLSQTCKTRRPLAVFVGASAAMVVVTLLGALSGHLLSRVIPAQVMHKLAAAAFILMGLWIAREALRNGREAADEVAALCAANPTRRGLWEWRVFATTFALLFVAEMGDKTQLAVLSLASDGASSVPVFYGGALALTGITALGVVGGETLARLVPERTLLAVSATAFVLMGLLMALNVF